MGKDQNQNKEHELRSQGPCGGHLRDACRELIRTAGKLEACEHSCRVGKTQLGRYQSGSGDFMPVDVVLDLETTAKMPAVTRVLARKAGYELTRLPALEVKGQIAEHLRIVFKESGDVIVSGADALEDNHISEEEAVSLHAETCEAIAALVHLRLLIEQRRPRLLNINIKDVLAG